MTNLQRLSLRNKIKQLVRNQPRSRTQENYRGSINLIYIHTDFLKPLFNCTNQRLHKNKNKEITAFPKNPPHLCFFLYKITETHLWLWICKALFISCSLFYTTECPFFCFPETTPFILVKNL